MGESSNIEWTDATVNFWWGCTKVGPGCDHCYAESFDKRVGGAHWGTGAPRRKIASATATLAKLNRQGGKRVFMQSMSDLFDNEVPDEWFDDAWHQICFATRCRIQIVTKRISMVEKRLQKAYFGARWPQHVGLVITVCNQAEADRDIPRLLALKAKLGIPWVGLSMEPLLGPVVLRPEWLVHLDWIIVGGESGPKARPMHPDWARSLRDQCHAASVSFFFKQWGEWGPDTGILPGRDQRETGADPVMEGARCAVWQSGAWHHYPSGLHVDLNAARGGGEWVYRLGKKLNGRLLDGREHNDMPRAL